MADANKTLITRAEFSSIITPATGRRALLIDGETTELGDTGPRDLSGLFITSAVASGQVVVQRRGNVVEWQLINVVLPAGATASWPILSNTDLGGILAPFMGSSGSRLSTGIVNGGDTARVRVSNGGNVELHYAETGVAWNFTLTLLTDRAWPTTLPGVALGSPVGV